MSGCPDVRISKFGTFLKPLWYPAHFSIENSLMAGVGASMNKGADSHTRQLRTTVHVRTTIPAEWARRLSHLSADLRLTKRELQADGVLLLLRFHGQGEGLPEPTPPLGCAK